MKREILFALLAALLAGLLTGCPAAYNQPPIALLAITSPSPMLAFEVPIAVEFDLSGSTDPDGTIMSYSLDFGDGTTAATGTDVTIPVSHTYAIAGIFTAVLTVTDNLGRTGQDNVTISTLPATIIFASKRYGGNYGIFQMKTNGADQGIVIDTDADELFPDLVLNTRDKIAYASNQDGGWNIWKVGVNGFGLLPTKLTTQTPSIQPSWSHDASKIAFASKSSGDWKIWRMTASGGSATALITQTPSWAPAYSPVDENTIVFVSEYDLSILSGGPTDESAIWLWDGSGDPERIYDSSGRDGDAGGDAIATTLGLDLPTNAGISKPAWSPDGTKIAFSRERTAGGIIDIWVMDNDGTNAESLESYVNSLLTSPVTAGTITSDYDEFCPYWLEDESGLAFVRKVGTTYNIYKVSFATGAVVQLTTSGDNVTPARERR